MPPLDDRQMAPGAAGRGARRRAADAGAGHSGPETWAGRHPEQAVFSQPGTHDKRGNRPYPRRYPPESWASPAAPQGRAAHPVTVSPRPLATPAPGPPPVSRAPRSPQPGGWAGGQPGWGRTPDEPPASLIGSLPAVEAYAQPLSDGRARGAGSAARRRADPSPSRLAYRLNRLWLTPLFRRGITMGLPALILAGGIALYLGDATRRGAIIDMASDLRAGFEARPEFRVEGLSVRAETPAVARAIESRLGLSFPVSSFHLDLPALRARIEALDAVESASLRVGAGRVLEVRAIEREPAFVWRHRDGLALIDAEGNRVALLASRAARADLPLIAGDGAPEAVAEASRLLAAAAPLEDRLHALLRVGERRWDLLLEGDRRIMLPGRGAVPALERVLALDSAPSDLLSRDVAVVDMRNPVRPTIRLSQPALAELHRIRSLESGVRNR